MGSLVGYKESVAAMYHTFLEALLPLNGQARIFCSLAAFEPSGVTRRIRFSAARRGSSIMKGILSVDAQRNCVQRDHLLPEGGVETLQSGSAAADAPAAFLLRQSYFGF